MTRDYYLAFKGTERMASSGIDIHVGIQLLAWITGFGMMLFGVVIFYNLYEGFKQAKKDKERAVWALFELNYPINIAGVISFVAGLILILVLTFRLLFNK